MIAPVENRIYPPGLEEREVGSFRNLTLLFIPYSLAGGSNTIRMGRWTWGKTC